jgi:hypothetical protein
MLRDYPFVALIRELSRAASSQGELIIVHRVLDFGCYSVSLTVLEFDLSRTEERDVNMKRWRRTIEETQASDFFRLFSRQCADSRNDSIV